MGGVGQAQGARLACQWHWKGQVKKKTGVKYHRKESWEAGLRPGFNIENKNLYKLQGAQ